MVAVMDCSTLRRQIVDSEPKAGKHKEFRVLIPKINRGLFFFPSRQNGCQFLIVPLRLILIPNGKSHSVIHPAAGVNVLVMVRSSRLKSRSPK